MNNTSTFNEKVVHDNNSNYNNTNRIVKLYLKIIINLCGSKLYDKEIGKSLYRCYIKYIKRR